MGTRVGVGFSDHRNPAEAGKEAAMKALEQAGVARPDFVFVFATVGYEQRSLIGAIRQATSRAPLSGCSGEGIITQEAVAETNFGVSVMVIRSDELRFDHASVREIGQGAAGAGERLAQEIRPLLRADSLACFILADGLSFHFDPFAEAFERTLGRGCPLPLYGGLAADNWASRKTYQYQDDDVFSDGLCGVLLSGAGSIAGGVHHGCLPVGPRRTVTRSKGNRIYEIDGVAALKALEDYLDEDWRSEWNRASLNLCLGFKAPEHIKKDYDEFFIRYMMDMDEREGSVTVQSDVPEGTDLWIMRRDRELIRSGLLGISRQIREQAGGRRPKFILHFECVGRGKVVFREKDKVEMIRTLQDDMGREVPWLGFYTYGEIGPIKDHNCFHNFSAVISAVY